MKNSVISSSDTSFINASLSIVEARMQVTRSPTLVLTTTICEGVMYLETLSACGAAARTGSLFQPPPSCALAMAVVAASTILAPSPCRHARTSFTFFAASSGAPGCWIAYRSNFTSSQSLGRSLHRLRIFSTSGAYFLVTKSKVQSSFSSALLRTALVPALTPTAPATAVKPSAKMLDTKDASGRPAALCSWKASGWTRWSLSVGPVGVTKLKL
mmetsp:Transcript_41489/g.65797  ORF Transcript_41489/g.65797 Transcript_41489/m.65797 type:complete len:214 (-) Transcript_41489:119-760(-)